MFSPNTPVDTATVYPGPLQRRRPSFVVTPAARHPHRPQPQPQHPPTTPTPDRPRAPLVTVVSVTDVKNKKHMVTEIVVDFSGPLNAAQADNLATYRLATANGKGSFTAKNSPVVKLRSAVFNPANDTVTLTPKKAFALTKPVELTINGTALRACRTPPANSSTGRQWHGGLECGRRDPSHGVTLNPVAAAAKSPSFSAHPWLSPQPALRDWSPPGAPFSFKGFNPTTPASPVVVAPLPRILRRVLRRVDVRRRVLRGVHGGFAGLLSRS